MFLGLGAPELIIILIVVLVIFGPKNLPKLGKSFGKTVKGIREGMEGDDKPAKAEATTEAKPAEDVVDVPHVGADDEDAPAEAAEDGKKFCGHCGAENPADNKFCKSCGAKLD